MKKIHWLLIIQLIFSCKTFAQDNNYLHIEGRLGLDSVQMELIISASNAALENNHTTFQYQGYYYFKNNDSFVALKSNFLNIQNKDTLILYHDNDDDAKREVFKGLIKNKTYQGVWTKGYDQAFPFRLEIKETVGMGNLQQYYFDTAIRSSIADDRGGIQQYKILLEWFLPVDNTQEENMINHVGLHDANDWKAFCSSTFSELYESYKMAEAAQNSNEIHLPTFNFLYIDQLYPVVNNDKYLVMLNSIYHFTADVNATKIHRYFTYDKFQQKFLYLSDVLDLTQRDTIEKILNQKIKEQLHLSPQDKLSAQHHIPFVVEVLTLSQDFTLSKNGITFYYPPSTVTPYFLGGFNFFIDYKSLKAVLNKGFQYRDSYK